MTKSKYKCNCKNKKLNYKTYVLTRQTIEKMIEDRCGECRGVIIGAILDTLACELGDEAIEWMKKCVEGDKKLENELNEMRQ